jgi:hypothetical protein
MRYLDPTHDGVSLFAFFDELSKLHYQWAVVELNWKRCIALSCVIITVGFDPFRPPMLLLLRESLEHSAAAVYLLSLGEPIGLTAASNRSSACQYMSNVLNRGPEVYL